FDEQPSSRAERTDHILYGEFWGGKVVQQPASMDEIEVSVGKRVDENVMLSYLEIVGRNVVEKPCVDIGRHDGAGRADKVTQPTSNRTATAADLETPIACAHTERLHSSLGYG